MVVFALEVASRLRSSAHAVSLRRCGGLDLGDSEVVSGAEVAEEVRGERERSWIYIQCLVLIDLIYTLAARS
jgi:hypothetical protein